MKYQKYLHTKVLVERCRFCGCRKGTPHASVVHLSIDARSAYEQYYPTWEDPPADFTTENMTVKMTYSERRAQPTPEQLTEIERYELMAARIFNAGFDADREFAKRIDAAGGYLQEKPPRQVTY